MSCVGCGGPLGLLYHRKDGSTYECCEECAPSIVRVEVEQKCENCGSVLDWKNTTTTLDRHKVCFHCYKVTAWHLRHGLVTLEQVQTTAAVLVRYRQRLGAYLWRLWNLGASTEKGFALVLRKWEELEQAESIRRYAKYRECLTPQEHYSLLGDLLEHETLKGAVTYGSPTEEGLQMNERDLYERERGRYLDALSMR